jgi:hypothetical protein
MSIEKKVAAKNNNRKGGKWLTQAEFRKATNLAPQTITKYATEKNPRIEQWILPSGKKLYWLSDGEKAFSMAAARKLRMAKNLSKKMAEAHRKTHIAGISPLKKIDKKDTSMEKINPKDLYSIDGFIKLTGLPKKVKPTIYQLIQDKYIPTVKDNVNKPKIHIKSSLAGLKMFREAQDAASKAVIKKEEETTSNLEVDLFYPVKKWAEEVGASYQGFVKYVARGVFDDCLLGVNISGTGERKFYALEWPGEKIAKAIVDIIRDRSNPFETCKVLLNRKVNPMILKMREEKNEPEVVEENIQPVEESIQPSVEESIQPVEESTQPVEEFIQPPLNGHDKHKAMIKELANFQDVIDERLKHLEKKVMNIGKAVKELVNQQLGF